MHNWLSSGLAEQLGWVIVHSIWQGCLIAAALYVVLILLRHRSATVRYAISVAAMFLFLLAPIGTWIVLNSLFTVPSNETTVEMHGLAGIASYDDAELVQLPVSEQSHEGQSEESAPITWAEMTDLRLVLPWISTIWMGGVVAYLAYFAGGWYTSRRLRFHGISNPPSSITRSWRSMVKSLGIKREVSFRLSEHINVPLTIGWWKPVVLLPISIVSGLPHQQLQALIAHELAHIRRHDYAVNIAQSVLEAIFFYHPGAWWISQHVRQEREFCCDDIAKQVANPLTYGRALATLQDVHVSRPKRLALAANDGALLQRIRRVVQGRHSGSVEGSTWVPASFVAIAACVIAATMAFSDGDATSPGESLLTSVPADIRAEASIGFPPFWNSNTDALGQMADRVQSWRAALSDTTDTKSPSAELPEAEVRTEDHIELIPDDEVNHRRYFGGVPLDTLRFPFVDVPDSVHVNLNDVQVYMQMLPHHLLHADSLAERMGALFPDSARKAIHMNLEEFGGKFPPFDTTTTRFFSPEGREQFQEEMSELRRKLEAHAESFRFERERFLEEFAPRHEQLRDSLEENAMLYRQQVREEAEAARDEAERMRERAEEIRREAENARQHAMEVRNEHLPAHLQESIRELRAQLDALQAEMDNLDQDDAAQREALRHRQESLQTAIEVLEDHLERMNRDVEESSSGRNS